MNRMNRIVSTLSLLAVLYLAVAIALSTCRPPVGASDPALARHPAPASSPWSPLGPPPWKTDCATDNECIA
jgi:hypothetical protein